MSNEELRGRVVEVDKSAADLGVRAGDGMVIIPTDTPPTTRKTVVVKDTDLHLPPAGEEEVETESKRVVVVGSGSGYSRRGGPLGGFGRSAMMALAVAAGSAMAMTAQNARGTPQEAGRRRLGPILREEYSYSPNYRTRSGDTEQDKAKLAAAEEKRKRKQDKLRSQQEGK